MLKEVINEKWKEAFKARDTVRRTAFEYLKQRIMTAEKSGQYTLPLTDDVVQNLIIKEYKERQGILTFYKETDAEYQEAALIMKILEEFLPKQLSEVEVLEIIKRLAVDETNTGKLIGKVVKEVGNNFDKSKIAGLVKQLCQK